MVWLKRAQLPWQTSPRGQQFCWNHTSLQSSQLPLTNENKVFDVASRDRHIWTGLCVPLKCQYTLKETQTDQPYCHLSNVSNRLGCMLIEILEKIGQTCDRGEDIKVTVTLKKKIKKNWKLVMETKVFRRMFSTLCRLLSLELTETRRIKYYLVNPDFWQIMVRICSDWCRVKAWGYASASVTSPVISTGSALSHSGVRLVWNEPIEFVVCDQTYILPVLLGQVAAVCVEIAEKHHVLPKNTAGCD